MVEVAAARRQRRQPPERPRETLEVGRRAVEMRARAIEPDPRAAFREVRQQRIEQVDQRAAHIGAVFQRIAGERVGAGGVVDHRSGSFSVVAAKDAGSGFGRDGTAGDGNDGMANLARGCLAVAKTGGHQADGFAPDRVAVDAHGG